ncbi:MAG: hypothetical protein PHD60_11780 [Clostridia bacterium]|nr:hypothetical protein [Clostridia bacterium]
MSEMEDQPVFIVCGDVKETSEDPDSDYIEVVSADSERAASDFVTAKYGRGNQTIYTPENCPSEVWAMVENAVWDGSGSFSGKNYREFVDKWLDEESEERDSLDTDTVTVTEQETYLAEILKGKSAEDLLKEIPKIADVVQDHYMDKIFKMKEADVKKRMAGV